MWSSSSDSLEGEDDLRDAVGPDVSEWRTYIRQLSTRDEFRALMSDMKETFKSETATVHQEVKAILDRVELVDEAQEDISNYTSQLHQHVIAQT